MKRTKALAIAALALSAAAFSTRAGAQDAFPNKSITMIVPAAAGGPSDTVARLVAEAMSADLGQRVLIENVGGAGGSLGTARVARAAPDGYTLLLYHIGVATFGTLYPNLTYRPGEDLSSVGLVTDVPLTLVGRKDYPAKTIAELLAHLKGAGTGATFGTAGVGAASDLCGHLFMEATGTKMTVVAYRGTGPAMNDLVGGQIDLMCDQTTNTASQIKGDRVRPYAVTTPKRIALLPALPTLAESGLKDFDLSAWHAVWTPRGTPEPVRLRLAAALRKALTDPRLVERFAGLGTTPVSPEMATPAALDARFKGEIDRWSKLLAGVKAPEN